MTRHHLARVIRDWIHDQPFSLCNASVDECPDWDMAYDLAEQILVVEWHEDDTITGPLHQHLGMTWDEYARWVERNDIQWAQPGPITQ